MIKILKYIDQIYGIILKALAVTLFLAMVVLVAAQVYTRFFTQNSLTWSEELSRYMMVYMVFISATLVARDKGHIRIENFVSKLKGTAHKSVVVLSILIQIAFLVIVLVGYVRFVPTAMMRISPTNHIPMAAVYFCVPLASGSILLYLIRDLVNAFTAKEGKA